MDRKHNGVALSRSPTSLSRRVGHELDNSPKYRVCPTAESVLSAEQRMELSEGSPCHKTAHQQLALPVAPNAATEKSEATEGTTKNLEKPTNIQTVDARMGTIIWQIYMLCALANF